MNDFPQPAVHKGWKIQGPRFKIQGPRENTVYFTVLREIKGIYLTDFSPFSKLLSDICKMTNFNHHF